MMSTTLTHVAEPPASVATPETAAPRTFLPRESLAEIVPDSEQVVVGFSRDDLFTVVGSLLAGLSVGVLLTLGLGLIPAGWLPILSYGWFVAIYTTLVFLGHPGPAVKDRFVTVMLFSAGAIVVAALVIVIGFTFLRGQNVFAQIFSADSDQNLIERLHFFTKDMGGVGPLAGLDQGGIFHALVGTLIQIGIALAITIPLGLLTAVFLNEVGGRFARFVRTIVEAMTALPSVVAGLFIYAAVIIAVTRDFNGFAASLAITVLMLPIMIRSSDIVLRLVPGNLREAGLALGAGQWKVVWLIVLPTVRSGLTTAIILATAHGIGETAPVLLTAGLTSNLNVNPFSGPMTSLPLAALEFVRSPQQAMVARGFATAAFLLFVVLVLFLIARAIGGQEAGKVSDAQARALLARSRSTQARIERLVAARDAQRAASAPASASAHQTAVSSPDSKDAQP